MNRRFGFVFGISGLVGLALLTAATSPGAGGDAPTVPRTGIVSLDLRTHKERVFPLGGDLAALSPEGGRVAGAKNPDNKQCLLYVHRLDGSRRRVLVRTTFPACPADPRWSPDGRMIAYSLFTKCAVGAPGCHPVQLWLVRTSGGAPTLLSNDAGTVAWAPASKRLAFPGEFDGGGLSRLTVENRDGSARVAFGSRHEIYSISWSEDGRKVLYSTNSPYFQNGGTGEIHVVSVATGKDSVVASGVDPAWSRDGKYLSYIRRTGNRTTLFLQGGRKVRTILSRPNFAFVHAWSRMGHRLAFAATNRFGQARIFVYDPGRSKPLRPVTRWSYGSVPSITWARDGHRILFARAAG